MLNVSCCAPCAHAHTQEGVPVSFLFCCCAPHRRPRMLLHMKAEQGKRAEQVLGLLLENGRLT